MSVTEILIALCFLFILTVALRTVTSFRSDGPGGSMFGEGNENGAWGEYLKYAACLYLLLFLLGVAPLPMPLDYLGVSPGADRWIRACMKALVWFGLAGLVIVKLAERNSNLPLGLAARFFEAVWFDSYRCLSEKAIQGEMDFIAYLIRNGKKVQALKRCARLEREGALTPATHAMVRGYLVECAEAAPNSTPVALSGQPSTNAGEATDPTSIDELIATQRFGSAFELLREELKARPRDFALFMKYLRLLAVDCGNPAAASRALRDAMCQRLFTPEEIEQAAKFMQPVLDNFYAGQSFKPQRKKKPKPHLAQVGSPDI